MPFQFPPPLTQLASHELADGRKSDDNRNSKLEYFFIEDEYTFKSNNQF